VNIWQKSQDFNFHQIFSKWQVVGLRHFVRPSHGLSGYLLLQFWSYSFNILYDVYTHNGGVHVHRIGQTMYLYPDGRTQWLSPTTCHFENQNPVDMHTSIMCINILQNIKAVAISSILLNQTFKCCESSAPFVCPGDKESGGGHINFPLSVCSSVRI
jgi:hypothetical protein